MCVCAWILKQTQTMQMMRPNKHIQRKRMAALPMSMGMRNPILISSRLLRQSLGQHTSVLENTVNE